MGLKDINNKFLKFQKYSYFLLIAVILYSIFIIIFFDSATSFSWLNTLFATIISVSFAMILVVIPIYSNYINEVLCQTKDEKIALRLLNITFMEMNNALSDDEDPIIIKTDNGIEYSFYLWSFNKDIIDKLTLTKFSDVRTNELLLELSMALGKINNITEQIINICNIADSNNENYKWLVKHLYLKHIKSKSELKEIINKYYKYSKSKT